MNLLPKVSVVIPVYNVKEHIEKCARSLFEQTLDSIEYIFVDDASPDNSIEILQMILKEYPNRARQTHIISLTTNRGLPSARKEGLQKATGEYVIHCDSDDWIDKDLYLKMYDEAKANNADMVLCDIKHEYKNKCIEEIIGPINTSGKWIMQNLHRFPFKMYTINKLVKREIYYKYSIFPWEGINIWEDMGLSTRLLYNCETISQVRHTFYHYNRGNDTALTHNLTYDKVNEIISIIQKVDDYYREKSDYKDFETSISWLKFNARANLINGSFKQYQIYRKTFPGSQKVIKYANLKGLDWKLVFRYKLAYYNLAFLFVLMEKLINLFPIAKV